MTANETRKFRNEALLRRIRKQIEVHAGLGWNATFLHLDGLEETDSCVSVALGTLLAEGFQVSISPYSGDTRTFMCSGGIRFWVGWGE